MEDVAGGEAPALKPADVGLMALAAVVARTRMEAGLDADASGAVDAMLGYMGDFAALGRVVKAPGLPWDAAALGVIGALRERLKRAAPVIARLARSARN